MTANFSSLTFAFLALAGGLTLLAASGEALVSGAVMLARRWRMSPLLIGLTIVAFGTSMPELFVSIAATLQGHPDIMIGNVLGSNVANIGLILGAATLLVPLHAVFAIIRLELLMMLGATALLAPIAWWGFFGRPVGLIFAAALVLYTVLSYRQAAATGRLSGEPEEDEGEPPSLNRALVMVFVGLGGLALGSDLFIDGAVDVALHFGVSELVIGLTLAAVGTSLPELASSLAAVRRRQSDLLLGNIVGSNLFNILMVFGCTAVVRPFAFDLTTVGRDLPVTLFFSVALAAIIFFKKRISRSHGLFFLMAYTAYVTFLFFS